MSDDVQYNPLRRSVVQAFLLGARQFSTWEVPDFVEALISHIRAEIKRVFYNVEQRPWDDELDPEIPGMKWRPFIYSDEDDSPERLLEAALPNFSFEDVEIRWYKYFGRGMSMNVTKSDTEWRQWYERAMEVVRAQDTCLTCFGYRGHLEGCPRVTEYPSDRARSDWYRNKHDALLKVAHEKRHAKWHTSEPPSRPVGDSKP